MGGIPEMIGDIPISPVPPDDVEALATQLGSFMADPRPYLRRAAELQKHVADVFSTEMMTREVVDFYISDLGAGPTNCPKTRRKPRLNYAAARCRNGDPLHRSQSLSMG